MATTVERRVLIDLSQIKFGKEIKDNLDLLMSNIDDLNLDSYRKKNERIIENDLAPDLQIKLNALTYDDTAILESLFNLYSTKADRGDLTNYRLQTTLIGLLDLDEDTIAAINATYDDSAISLAISNIQTALQNYRLTTTKIESEDLSENLITSLAVDALKVFGAINGSEDMTIDDKNLSEAMNEAMGKAHEHENMDLLNDLSSGIIDAINESEGTISDDRLSEGANTAIGAAHTHENMELLQSLVAPLEKSGGTMTGKLVADNNVNFDTAQVRNIILSPDPPSGGANGDIWIQYVPVEE